jgi:hypothetical protein
MFSGCGDSLYFKPNSSRFARIVRVQNWDLIYWNGDYVCVYVNKKLFGRLCEQDLAVM